MTRSPLPLLAAFGALLAPSAAAQFSVIKGGTGDGLTRMTTSNLRALATPADGTLWTILYRHDASATTRELFLRRSTDAGATWTGKFVVPMPSGHVPNSLASIHMDRRCDRLHVVFSAGNPHHSAYHAEFDARRQQWIGQPVLLSPRATSTNSQMYGKDVVVTDAGSVVVAIQCHRGPPPNWTRFQRGNWATAIRVRKAGATTFGPRMQINTEVFGATPNMIAIGEVVHFSYRSAIGGYGINYRAYDTANDTFVHGDVHVGPNDNVGLQASNVSQILADQKGALYVMYATPGKLRFAYSKAGSHAKNSDWTDVAITSDASIRGGNVSQRFYAAVAASSSSVFAFYAKPSEKLQTLYMRIYLDGKPIGNEAPVQRTTLPNRFEWVNGFRNTHVVTGARYFTWGRSTDPARGPGQVDYFRPGGTGRAVVYGAGCRGSLTATPRLFTADVPQIGRALKIDCTRNPANRPGVFALGAACLATPVDLRVAGMPGCALHNSIATTFGFVTGATGAAAFSATAPNNPGLIGLGVHFQAVTVAPGANAGGAIVSNSLAAIF